jgi:hypothetical protein
MPPQPVMPSRRLVQDDWSYAGSSTPLLSFDHAAVDWQQLSEEPESAISRSVLAGIACNQRVVGLSPQHWHQSVYQVNMPRSQSRVCLPGPCIECGCSSACAAHALWGCASGYRDCGTATAVYAHVAGASADRRTWRRQQTRLMSGPGGRPEAPVTLAHACSRGTLDRRRPSRRRSGPGGCLAGCRAAAWASRPRRRRSRCARRRCRPRSTLPAGPQTTAPWRCRTSAQRRG